MVSLNNPTSFEVDYSSVITMSSGFVAPKNGVIYTVKVGTGGSDASLQTSINGQVLGTKQRGYANSTGDYFAIVAKGDVVTWSAGGGGSSSYYFFPMKG